MKKRFSDSLYGTMLMMVVLPMACLGAVVTIFCAGQYTNAIHKEIEKELENVCNLTLAAMDVLYQGDYTLEDNGYKVVRKGGKILNGDYLVLDRIKAETGIDVTFFYYDTRILTTILDESGNRIVGTGGNAVVMKEVYEEQQPRFYETVDVLGEDYYSYYKPVYNSDGSCVGMIFAGKPSNQVVSEIRHAAIPTAALILILLFLAGCICFFWAKQTVEHIRMIQKFLSSMAEGRFSEEMNPAIMKRNDEICSMGIAAVQMQQSLKNLVEKDVLTGLNNRRYGIIRLEEVRKKAEITGMPFSVALGDIDFFKKINDTYGHDCGDQVLQAVSGLLGRHMAGMGFAIRWGGEEFLLVYTKLSREEAARQVEALQQELRELKISYGDAHIKVTMSFGVSEGTFGESADVWLKAADSRLYYGKEHGRNQVVSVLPGQEDEVEGDREHGVEEPSL